MVKIKRRLFFLLILVSLCGVGYFVYQNVLVAPPSLSLVSLPSTSIVKTTFKIAVMSDIHSDLPHLKQALDKVKNRGIDTVILNGDLTTVGTRDELTAIKKVLDDSQLKYYAVPGNHDYWFINKSHIDVYGEILGYHYQSFTAGGNKFILVDDGGPVVEDKQITWLKQELSDCQKIACLVFTHKPFNHPTSEYTLDKDLPEASKELTALFVKNNVQEIFAGHLHTSYHYELNGLTTTLDGAVTDERNWQTPRFLEVSLSSNGDVLKREEVVLD